MPYSTKPARFCAGQSRLALISAAAVCAMVGLSGPAAAQQNMSGPLVLKDSGTFFVGGDLELSPAISGNPNGPAGFGYSNSDYITVNQMYVQFEVPMASKGIYRWS